MADIPNVTFHALSDHPMNVFVHLGGKVRSFAADTEAKAKDLITKVMIAEFGVPQAEADAAAAAAFSRKQTKIDDAAHLALLQEQMADTDKQLTDAINARMKAESDLKLAQSEITDLKKAAFVASETISQMEAVSLKENEAAIAAMPQNNPPATGGVVSTPAEATPPAETSAPHAQTGPAPTSAGTGGAVG